MLATSRLPAALAGAALATMAAAGPAAAGGFYIQDQSVRGLGRANAGEAAETGADSLWWNPAAIAGGDERELDIGLFGAEPKLTVADEGSTIQRPFGPTTGVGGQPSTQPVDPAVGGALEAAWRVAPRWTIGLAVTAPFSFKIGGPRDAWSRYQGRRLELINVDIQPTLAWRATPWLDVGVGLDAVYGRATIVTALPNLSPLAPDGQTEFKGDGWSWGWTAGVQLRPSPALTIGASYRSQIDHALPGRLATAGLSGPLSVGNGVTPSTASYPTPQMATLALQWRFARRLSLEAQAQWLGWSAFDAIHVSNPHAIAPSFPKARDTLSLAVGMDWAASSRWTLRAGVQSDPQAISDSAVLADADRLIVGAGATWRASPRLAIDAALADMAFRSHDFHSDASAYIGTPLMTPITLRGRFSANALIFSAGARMRF